jgi:formylmethanofuran dehydrogenase subunit C
MDFVVTADTASDSSGNMTIPISPSIVLSGQWQNVSATPTDNGAVTIFGHASSYANVATRQGLIFTKGAFAMVTADLEKPMGVWASERISNKAVGIAIRFVKDYSILTDQSPARLDTIYGFKSVRPEMSVRVCS